MKAGIYYDIVVPLCMPRNPLTLIPAIHRASHAIAAFVDAEIRLRITQAEAHILAYLATTGAASVGQIYDAFGHKRSTLTSILNRLEDRGLVSCTVNETDKRSFIIGLTPEGQELADGIHNSLKALEDEVLSAFLPRDHESALRLLATVTRVTGEQSATT